MNFYWIPEAPGHPGLYANARDMTGSGGRTDQLQPSTMNANLAKRFASREDCQRWCDEHPEPPFVPTEHGFDGT
jgi:hypothetical protein